MGTHPIFESDFDCLTEKKYNRDSKKYGESKRDRTNRYIQTHC